jgi:hypothetical protein
MTRTAGRRFLAALVGTSFVAVASATAWSVPLPSGRVALLDPPGSSSSARQCLTRIREELTAGGFEVSVVDPGPRVDPVSIAAAMQRQEGTIATIALLGDPDRPGTELWILDRVGAAAEVRRIPIPTEDRERLPEVLAIRTIEVLKASALKVLVEATRPAPEAKPAVVVTGIEPPVRTAEATGAFGLEAGLAMVTSVGGFGPAAVPVGRVRAWLGNSVFARLTLAGLGSRPRVETSIGSASVAQSLGLVELAVALRPGARWRPTFSLGAGTLYVQSEGEGVWPYAGLRETRWAAAVDAGIGLLATVGGNLSLGFEVHGLVALPHPTVRFFDVESATVGFPAIVASITMIAWL